MRGLEVPHGVYVALCGTDIVRTNEGFVVLEDNLRVPSGVSYMLANRRALKTSLRNLFRRHRVRGIEHYGQLLRQTLAELAPPGVSDPCIVLLTPGVYNSAFYEHMFLAQEMGIELVQGSDLLVHNGFVYMRTTAGLRKVDVIYRRIDDDFIDPLAFRADSQLGTPGLFYAYRLGNVTIANAPGTGIADDKSVYAYVPDMIRYYLGEEPLLANVDTHLCREPEGLEYTLDNLETLIVKMVGESGGYGMLVGPQASPAERAAYAEELRRNPANYVSQPVLDLSVSPCLTPDGAAPRHVDLRPFVLRGREIRLVPGAFCRVALVKGSLVVNSSQGGGGKDLWGAVGLASWFGRSFACGRAGASTMSAAGSGSRNAAHVGCWGNTARPSAAPRVAVATWGWNEEETFTTGGLPPRRGPRRRRTRGVRHSACPGPSTTVQG